MPDLPRVAVLCGGFGAARFVPALAGASSELCCIVNTADDLEHLGVHISPDVDSVCYALAAGSTSSVVGGSSATPSSA